MSLTHRLFVLVLLALLPAVAIQAYNEFDLRRARQAEVHATALRQGQHAASELRQILEGVRNFLTAAAEVPAVRDFDEVTCSAYLARVMPQVPHLFSLGALDAEGTVRCAPDLARAGVRLADRPYFQAAIGGEPFVVGVHTRGRVSDRPILPVAMPMRDGGGPPRGAVVAYLDLGWLGAHLSERALTPGGALTIADRDGVILAREPQPEKFVGTRIPDAFQHLVRSTAPGSLEVVSQDGARRVIGYVPAAAPPAGLYVSAGVPYDASFAAIERGTRRGVALIATGLLLALAVAALAGRRFVRAPVGRLVAAAARWRAGDYAARSGAPPGGGGELGELGRAFDAMAADIGRRDAERERTLAALEVTQARLRRAQEVGGVGDCEWDFETGRLTCSRSFYGLFGLPPDAPAPAPRDLLALVDRGDRARVEAELRAARAAGGAFATEFRVRRPDGATAWLAARGTVAPAATGAPARLLGVAFDVTPRRELEDRLRLVIMELNHRVKNTLATVTSIAARSLAGGRTLAEARHVFLERVVALAKAHDLLTASAWGGVPLVRLVEGELEPYADRAMAAGPEVTLTPRAAQTLSLVLHELATNAAKHGALASPDGRVEVRWSVAGPGKGPGPAELRLEWREAGGPPVAAPGPAGFGTRLLERAVAHDLGGRARLRFEPGGLVYALAVPMGDLAVAAAPTSPPGDGAAPAGDGAAPAAAA